MSAGEQAGLLALLDECREKCAALQAQNTALAARVERLLGTLSAAEGALAQIDYRSTPEVTVRGTVTNLKMMIRAALSPQAEKEGGK